MANMVGRESRKTSIWENKRKECVVMLAFSSKPYIQMGLCTRKASIPPWK